MVGWDHLVHVFQASGLGGVVLESPNFSIPVQNPVIAVDVHWLSVALKSRTRVSSVVRSVHVVRSVDSVVVANEVWSHNVWVAELVVTVADTNNEVEAVIGWC